MGVPPFAMSPLMLPILAVALPVVLVFLGLFVSATRTEGKRGERNRRAMLGLMAILCGPPVGASLAWLSDALGQVHPADVGWNYLVFSIIGGVAGGFAGVAFAITGLFAPHASGGEDLPDKPAGYVTDEL